MVRERGEKVMKTKLWFTILGIVILGILVAPPLAGAETLKWRQTLYVSKVEQIEVGDVPGHIVGVAEGGGVAFFENGEVATYWWKGTIDYTKGAGTSLGYMLCTFEDESTFLHKYQVLTTADPNGKGFWWKGVFTFLQGSGRFAGIQGDGTFTGKRFGGPAAGTQGYMDFTATYTLPPR
jgi:hypothetical protein